MSVTPRTKIILAFRSGGICAFPNCGEKLTTDGKMSGPVSIGEAAHIAGKKPGSARYDETMTDEQRDHCDNLIYLCDTHHTLIDKLPEDFTITNLLNMKSKHEQMVRRAISEAAVEVNFMELETATGWILEVKPVDTDVQDFSLIPPEDKIRKNKLDSESRAIITTYLGTMRDVGAYIESVSKIEPDFPERLKFGFLSAYYEFKKEGYDGDDLFDLMCSFAQRGFRRQAQKSAGLAILVYLFETCEVFEK